MDATVALLDGEIRPDVDTHVLETLISGPVLQAALRGAAREVDEAWADDLVSVVLDGVRCRPRRSRSADHHRTVVRP